jgi:hypothetical protein
MQLQSEKVIHSKKKKEGGKLANAFKNTFHRDKNPVADSLSFFQTLNLWYT